MLDVGFEDEPNSTHILYNLNLTSTQTWASLTMICVALPLIVKGQNGVSVTVNSLKQKFNRALPLTVTLTIVKLTALISIYFLMYEKYI